MKRVKQQTVAPENITRSIKAYAGITGKRLQDIYDEALSLFITHHKNNTVNYLASPKGSRPVNMLVTQELAQKVKQISKDDAIALRRVLYTAIIFYIKIKNIKQGEYQCL